LREICEINKEIVLQKKAKKKKNTYHTGKKEANKGDAETDNKGGKIENVLYHTLIIHCTKRRARAREREREMR
jgi:hypothetical protein